MFAADVLRGATSGLLDLLLPARCVICGSSVDTARSSVPLCRSHRRKLPVLTPPRCYRCSRPLAGPDLTDRPVPPGGPPGGPPPTRAGSPRERAPLCGPCRRTGSPLVFARAAYTYTDPLRTIVRDWKFGGCRAWGSWLGNRMARILRNRLDPVDWTGLVPIPLSEPRRGERGFNQAAQLAGALGETLGLPVTDLLRKTRATPPQSGLPRSRRLDNLEGVFSPRAGAPSLSGDWLLVDDIYTTGATLATAAGALRDGGAGSTAALVLARSVAPHRRPSRS